jgi:hypothetical protein
VSFRTEYPFTLPRGYVDQEGRVHREGVMRLATARDEIVPVNDVRVQRNQAYLVVLLLSRVITKLGDLPEVTPAHVENLFASDLRFLEELYNRVNEDEAQLRLVCPACEHAFEREYGTAGES